MAGGQQVRREAVGEELRDDARFYDDLVDDAVAEFD